MTFIEELKLRIEQTGNPHRFAKKVTEETGVKITSDLLYRLFTLKNDYANKLNAIFATLEKIEREKKE